MATAPDNGHSVSELPVVATINGAAHAGLTSETANERQDRRDREDRAWSHGLHQDQEFIQRGNFFLVAESLLVVAYSGILTKGLAAGADGEAFKLLLSARVISAFGLLLSIIWIYVSNYERETVEYLMKRARRLIPDYQVVFEGRPKSKISTNLLMTFMVPALAGIMWAFFVAIAY